MAEPIQALRQHSARMRGFVTVLWWICFLLVVLERFSAVTIQLIRNGFAGEPLRAFACQAVAAFPEAVFLLGLWWVRETLAAFARGELFASSMTRMLDRVGVLLASGAAARILLVPGACRLLGFDAGHWIAFDAASVVLGAIGIALKVMAEVLRHAGTIQSELDEIF